MEEELGLNVAEVVDSIVSMEKIFDPDGVAEDYPTGDLEEGEKAGAGRQRQDIEFVSPTKQPMIIPSSSLGPE